MEVLPAVSGLFDHFQGGGIEKNDGGKDPVIALCAGDVGPRDNPDIPRPVVTQNQLPAQISLYGHRRFVVDIPRM
jgi:hypothetical protein